MATWANLIDPTKGTISPLSVVSIQNPTDSAPTLATDGQALAGIGGFTLVLEADLGQTLTGAGNLLGFSYDSCNGWARSPDIDVQIPSAAAGQRRVAFPGWTISNPRGSVAHVAAGVGVSSGGLSLYYCCTTVRAHRT
jgi:hypothetical protein